MGTIGDRNPCPTHIGGNASPAEKVWRALRKAVGTRPDGSDAAGPVDGIEDTWRLAKARAIAAALGLEETAVAQAFPMFATVALDAYERELGVPLAATEQERREAVSAAFTAGIDAVVPHIRAALQAIDSGLDVVTVSSDTSTWTQFGKTMGSRVTPEMFVDATRGSAAYPNFSQHFVLVVRWTGAPGGIPPAEKLATLERYLNTVLPSWFDYSIENGSGFYLDGFNDSALDLTSFD